MLIGFSYDDTDSIIRDSFDKLVPETTSILKQIFGYGNRPVEEILEEMVKSNSYEKVANGIKEFYANLFEKNGRRDQLNLAGVKNPLSILKIDGQSILERYGKKYENYIAEDARVYMLMEFINELYQGDHKVTMDTFVVNRDGKYEQGDPWVIADTATNFERTKDLLRNVDYLHSMAVEAKAELDNTEYLFNSTKPEFEVIKNSLELLKGSLDELIKCSSVSGEGNMLLLSNAWKDYQLKSEMLYRNAKKLYQTEDAIEKDYENLEKFHLSTENRLAGQFSVVLNSTKYLDVKLIPGPNDPEFVGRFSHIHDCLKKQAKIKGYGDERVLLHGEAVGKLPVEYEWVDQIDDVDVKIQGPDRIRLMEKAQLSIAGNTPNQYVSNIRSIRSTDFEDIIGKNTKVDDFLTNRSIPFRATGENIFLFYCIGVKGLSIPQALEMIHAHDKDEKGEYVNAQAHNTAVAFEKDFMRFIKQYPLDPPEGFYKTKEEAKKGAGAWLKLYKNLADTLKAYSWPDIDYSDVEQVKPHFEELYLLHNCFGDGLQELDRLLAAKGYNEFFDFVSVGEEVFGKEEDYRGMHRFFSETQGVTALAFVTPYFSPVGETDFTYGRIASIATGRAFAGDFMSTYAGKPIGKSVAENEQKTMFATRYSVDWPKLSDGRYTEGGVAPGICPEPKDTIAFLLNQNKGALKEWMAPYKKIIDDNYRKYRFPTHAFNLFCNNMKYQLKPVVKQSILQTGDDAQSMINYLNSAVGKKTGKDIVLSEQKLWFDRDERYLFYRFGLKESDMFLIDGKSAKELWGVKYAGVKDETLKENLYRAEILKTMAAGKSTIALRNVDMSPEFVITLSKPQTVLLPDEKLRQMYDAYCRYTVKKGNLLSQLKQMKKDLSETEPAGTVFGEGGGSERYVNFTSAVNDAIRELSKKGIDDPVGQYGRIKETLINLENAANTYYEANKNSSKETQKKRAACADLVKSGVVLALDQERNILNVDLLIDGETTFANINEYKLKNGIDHFANRIGRPNPEDSVLEDAYVREQIGRKIFELTKAEEVQKIMATDPATPKKRALQYLIGIYKDISAKALPGEKEKNLLTYADLRKAERILTEVPLYEANDIFQKYMEEDPDKTIKGWRDVERGAEMLRQGYEKLLTQYTMNSGSLSRYVGGIISGQNPNLTLSEEVYNNSTEPDENVRNQNLDGMYSRLAEVVLLQILAKDTETSRQIRESILQKDTPYENYLNVITTLMKANGVLRDRRTAEKLENQIANGKVAEDTLKHLLENAVAAKKEQDIAKKQVLATEDAAFREQYGFLYVDNPEPLTEEQINRIREDSGLNAEKDQRNLYVDVCKLLKKPLTYTENGQNISAKLEGETYTNLGLIGTNAHQALFMLWTMATMDKSFEEAMEFCQRMPGSKNGERNITEDELNEANKARALFHQFCVENRTQIGGKELFIDPVQHEKAFRNWAEIFRLGTEKFKEYRLPDIDFRKKDQISANLQKIVALSFFTNDIPSCLAGIFSSDRKVNGVRILSETLGGEERMKDLSNFWWNASTSTYPLFASHVKPASGLGEDGVNNEAILTTHAGMRFMGVSYMQQIKGMNMEQAAEYARRNGWLLNVKQMMETVYESAMDANGYSVIDATLESSIRYLVGKDAPHLEKAVEDYKKKETQKQEKELTIHMRSDLARVVSGFEWGPQALETIGNLPDNDVDAMRNFLKSEGEYDNQTGSKQVNGKEVKVATCTGKDFVMMNINRMLGFHFALNTAMAETHIKQVDLFLIDGKTPTELYANKYIGIPEGPEKEQLYYLEVMKEVALGRRDVSLRTFAVENGRIVESTPMRVAPKRDAAFRQVLENVHMYSYGVDDIITSLTTIRTELTQTQDNPRANFFKQPDEDIPNFERIRPEGHSKYRLMAEELRKLIHDLEIDKAGNREQPKQDMLDGFDRLIAAAAEYHRSHTWSLRRGIWTEKGRARRKISARIVETVRKLKEEYLANRKGMETDYISSSYGLEYKDASYFSVIQSVKTFEKKYHIPAKTEEEYKNQFNYDKYTAIYESFLAKTVQATAAETMNHQRVNRYFNGVYNDIKEKGIVDEAYQKTGEQLENQYKNLVKNPVFQNMMKENPQLCIQMWGKAESNANTIKQQVVQKMTAVTNSYGGSSAYIVGLPSMEHPNYTGFDISTHFTSQQMAEAIDQAKNPGGGNLNDGSGIEPANANNEYLNGVTERAATVILWQMLAKGDEQAIHMFWAFAADETMGDGSIPNNPTLFEKARDAIAQDLRNRGVFSANNFERELNVIRGRGEVDYYRGYLPELCPDFAAYIVMPDAPSLEEADSNLAFDAEDSIMAFGEEDSFLANEEKSEKEKLIFENNEDEPEVGTNINMAGIAKENDGIEDEEDAENERENEAENDELSQMINNIPPIEEENLLLNPLPLVANHELNAGGEQNVNLLEKPNPEVLPIAHPVIQPVIPEFGRQMVQHAVIRENLPIVDQEALIPQNPIVNIPILDPVQAPIPKNQIIQNAAKKIAEENPEQNIVIQPINNTFQMYHPEVQSIVEPKAEPKPRSKFVAPKLGEINTDSNQINEINTKSNQINEIIDDYVPLDNFGENIFPTDFMSDAEFEFRFGTNNANSVGDVKVILDQSKWMFPLDRKTNLPLDILKTGDLNALGQQLKELEEKDQKDNVTQDDIRYLHRVIDAKNEITNKAKEVSKKMITNQNPGSRLPVVKLENGVEILGTEQYSFQTSHFGCWSCSAELLLQGRGIIMNQELIRAYRGGNDISQDKNLPPDETQSYNKDCPNKIMDAGDLMTSLAPDSMVRELEILQRPNNSKMSNEEYLNKAMTVLAEQIHKAIERDKSPVSLLRHGHYVTVVGIRQISNEPWVKVKDSMPHPGDTDPDKSEWKPLREVIGNGLNSTQRDNRGISISWMADIKMDQKTNKITNAPSSSVLVQRNGTVEFPDQKIQENTKLNFGDERQRNGAIVATMGGQERTDYNMLDKDGLLINDKAYIPKQLNYQFLLNKAKKSNFQLEVENAKERITKYDIEDPTFDARSKERYQDKLLCTTLLVSAAYLKVNNIPLDDKNGGKFYDVSKNDPMVAKIAKKFTGEEILAKYENNTLLKEMSNIAQIAPKANPTVQKGGNAAGSHKAGPAQGGHKQGNHMQGNHNGPKFG